MTSDMASSYGDSRLRDPEACFRNGVFCYHTCSLTSQFPSPYILGLASQTYPNEKYSNFTDAFESYLMGQFLQGVIGGHNIL